MNSLNAGQKSSTEMLRKQPYLQTDACFRLCISPCLYECLGLFLLLFIDILWYQSHPQILPCYKRASGHPAVWIKYHGKSVVNVSLKLHIQGAALHLKTKVLYSVLGHWYSSAQGTRCQTCIYMHCGAHNITIVHSSHGHTSLFVRVN